MESNELRIGNYIHTSIYQSTKEAKDDLGEDYSIEKEWLVDEVEAICHPDDEFFYLGKLNIEEGTFRTKGIPLTREWLIGFGMGVPVNKKNDIFTEKEAIFDGFYSFKQVEQSLIDATFEIDCFRFFEDSNGFWFPILNTFTHIQYVHEFQNLYFALTKQELKLKDNE